jgi:hypothetical protein
MRPTVTLMLLLGLVVPLGLAACKGDAVKCEQGCRNYGALVFWKNAEIEIAAAAPDKRDDLRKTMLGKFNTDLDGGIALCVSQCQSANNTDDVECMIAAKTGDQAVACFK